MKTPQIINKEIDGYKDTSQIKEHELKLLEIIENENKIHNQHVLIWVCFRKFSCLLRKNINIYIYMALTCKHILNCKKIQIVN